MRKRTLLQNVMSPTLKRLGLCKCITPRVALTLQPDFSKCLSHFIPVPGPPNFSQFHERKSLHQQFNQLMCLNSIFQMVLGQNKTQNVRTHPEVYHQLTKETKTKKYTHTVNSNQKMKALSGFLCSWFIQTPFFFQSDTSHFCCVLAFITQSLFSFLVFIV